MEEEELIYINLANNKFMLEREIEKVEKILSIKEEKK
jgi:hypothetical protein